MYINAIINFFNWNGRINRRQYLVVFIIFCVLMLMLATAMDLRDPRPIVIIWAILLFPSKIKRLHDMDYSGWWVLIEIIPVIGQIIGIIMALGLFICSGSKGKNKYGDLPETEVKILNKAVSAGIQRVSNTVSDTIRDFQSGSSAKEIQSLKGKLRSLEIEALQKRIKDLEDKVK